MSISSQSTNSNDSCEKLNPTSLLNSSFVLLSFQLIICISALSYSKPTSTSNDLVYTQNEALRIATGCHKMSNVDHLHAESKVLKGREHPELLSAQYLTRCLEAGNVCHSITTRKTSKRRMKDTLFTRHRNTVEPMMLADNRKATLHAIHTDAVVVVCPLQPSSSVNSGCPGPESSILVSSRWACPISSQVTDH